MVIPIYGFLIELFPKHYRGDEIAYLRNLSTSRDKELTWSEVKAELNRLRCSP